MLATCQVDVSNMSSGSQAMTATCQVGAMEKKRIKYDN